MREKHEEIIHGLEKNTESGKAVKTRRKLSLPRSVNFNKVQQQREGGVKK
jgi:hypothetical protein